MSELIVLGAEFAELEPFLRSLRAVKYEISKRAVARALKQGAIQYEQRMVPLAPVGHTSYGYMRRSGGIKYVRPYKYKYRGRSSKAIGTTKKAIKTTSHQDFEGPAMLVRVTRGRRATHDAFYAMFVHQGTRRITRPNKWATRASDSARPHAVEAIISKMKLECRKLGFKDGEA